MGVMSIAHALARDSTSALSSESCFLLNIKALLTFLARAAAMSLLLYAVHSMWFFWSSSVVMNASLPEVLSWSFDIVGI